MDDDKVRINGLTPTQTEALAKPALAILDVLNTDQFSIERYVATNTTEGRIYIQRART